MTHAPVCSFSGWLIDTHAHLDGEEFENDREAVLERARAAGVAVVICPAISAASSEAVVRLARDLPGVACAVGIQPNYGAEARDGDWDRVVALASEPGVVAIGETGLDRHWDFTPFDVQRALFDRHLRLAQDRDLPLIIHCREAEDDTLAMTREAAQRGPLRGVIHAFSGDASFAQACLDLGMYISFAGAVTYTNAKFNALREAARQIPSGRILLETDSPYLTPHPLRGKIKRNEPAHLPLTARALAEIRHQPIEELAAQTTSNARTLFNAWNGEVAMPPLVPAKMRHDP